MMILSCGATSTSISCAACETIISAFPAPAGSMAGHHRLNAAQRRCPAQLREQQGDQLVARGEAARHIAGQVFGRQSVENRPWYQFEDVMKDAIDMAHGVDPYGVQLSRKTLNTIRINAVHLAQQKSSRTAVGQARP